MASEAARANNASTPVSRAAAVAAGGALGALLRFGMTGFSDPPDATMLIVVNTLGALALGALFGIGSRPGWPQWLRDGLGTGLLGGFTTMSGLAGVALVPVLAGSATMPAAWVLLVITGSILLGVPAARLGWRLTEKR